MKHSIKHYLFTLKWPVAIVVFVIFTGFVGENCWINRLAQKQEIANLKGEIDEYERKFRADRDVLHRMESDGDAAAEVARQRYLMKKADEDVFVFDE